MRQDEVRHDISELQTRTSELEQRIAASRAQAPNRITVLLMAGTPEGGEQALRLDRETREIDAKVQVGRYREQIRLVSTQATRITDIVDALNRYTPDVVHFSGHGHNGTLLFDGPDGTPRALLGAHLALLLQAAPRPIKMVVFNACESAAHALSATEFAEFAVGMERSIGDETAKEWAGQFYGSLAAGVTIGLAFRQAVAHATALAGGPEPLGEPQLHARAGADAEATVLVNPDSD
jgi:CHAT domain-containing protein